MSRKKILWCGESSHLPTGFGNYTREILSRLHQTGKYELAELSCYRSCGVKKTEPWKIYPVIPNKDDPFKKIYDTQPICEFGQVRFEFALLDFKPDIVIDVRDFWYLAYQNISPLRQFFHWMIAPTYDSIPQPKEAMRIYEQADSIMFHSDWAMRDFLSYYSTDKCKGLVSDAVDYSVFHSLDKSSIRKKYGIPDSSFIIGSVMRNQQRKLIPDLFKILKTLTQNNESVYLYLQTTYPESNAWDIPRLLLEHGVQNNVLFSYFCKTCNNFYPSVFQGIENKCHYCGANGHITNTNRPINQEQLNTVYNFFDVYLQYSVCEGFGIPQIEAAASGIPVITIDHGAMKEVGENIGAEIIPIKTVFKDIACGTDRVYPDNDICINILSKYVNMSKEQLYQLGQKTRELSQLNYSWSDTAKKFESIIDGVVMKKKQGQWNDPSTLPQYIQKELPQIDNNRKFIYYIVDNILYAPELKKTYFIEDMICSLDYGYHIGSNKTTKYTRDNAILSIQSWINNKYGLEKIRLKKESMPTNLHSFLNY